MRPAKLFALAAVLALGGSLLHAAPDRGDKNGERQEMKEERNVRTVKGMKNIETPRDDVRTPGMVKRVQSAPKTAPYPTREVERKIVRPEPKVVRPQSNVVRPQPKVVSPHPYVGREVTVRKHNDYRRPPGVRALPYYHRPGYVIRTLPRVAVTLSLGGLFFYYADGIYYRHAVSGFIVSVPPVGLFVPTLPPAHTVFIVDGHTYYYYADVYYVWDNSHTAYRVVNAPEVVGDYRPGDIVDTLPDGAYTVTIDGKQYYRYADVYFMQAIQGDRIVYIVVTP